MPENVQSVHSNAKCKKYHNKLRLLYIFSPPMEYKKSVRIRMLFPYTTLGVFTDNQNFFIFALHYCPLKITQKFFELVEL